MKEITIPIINLICSMVVCFTIGAFFQDFIKIINSMEAKEK